MNHGGSLFSSSGACYNGAVVSDDKQRKQGEDMAAPEEGIRLAEGIYSYTLDDRPYAAEVWRINRLEDNRVHMQALLGVGQQMLYGMDLVLDQQGEAQSLDARVQQRTGLIRASLTFSADAVRGQSGTTEAPEPIDLTLPPQTCLFPESIAMRFLLGQRLDLTTEADQVVSLCSVPVLDEHQPALKPRVVTARATVLGPEPVELLMATVTATRVLIEIPDHPPQHGWFDDHRFPVQWYRLGDGPQGERIAHEFALTRYAWH